MHDVTHSRRYANGTRAGRPGFLEKYGESKGARAAGKIIATFQTRRCQGSPQSSLTINAPGMRATACVVCYRLLQLPEQRSFPYRRAFSVSFQLWKKGACSESQRGPSRWEKSRDSRS